MAEYRATYRAIADFSDLDRAARRAKRSLQDLRGESVKTNEDLPVPDETVEGYDDLGRSIGRASVAARKNEAATKGLTRERAKEEAAIRSVTDAVADGVAEAARASAGWEEYAKRQSETESATKRVTVAVAEQSDAQRQWEAGTRRHTASVRAMAAEYQDAGGDIESAHTAFEMFQRAVATGAAGGGGGGGRTLATDVGNFGRIFAKVAAGALASLLLILPTVNLIVAALVGVVALLVTAAVAVAAFGAAFIGVGAAIVFAMYKWRDLVSEGTAGTQSLQRSILAVEAAAFNAGKRIAEALTPETGAGDIWDTLAQGAIKAINVMEPYITRFLGWIVMVSESLSGAAGSQSAFVDFLKVWGAEWQKLVRIVNQDIEVGAGLQKYEAPAKAFVEGIARMINAIRKLAAMGFGLDMQELAEFIDNVFKALSRMLPLWSRFSSALTPIALQLSRMLLTLMPLIEQIVAIGATIMESFVAPLVRLGIVITQGILQLPLIGWLVALLGGLKLVDFAIRKLTFGFVSFAKVMGSIRSGAFVGTLAIGLERVINLAKAAYLAMQTLGTGGFGLLPGLTGVGAAIAGISATVAGAVGAYLLWTNATNTLTEAQSDLESQSAKTADKLGKGLIDPSEAISQWREQFRQLGERTSVMHANPVVDFLIATKRTLEALKELDWTTDAEKEAEFIAKNLAKYGNEMVKNAMTSVAQIGRLSDAQVMGLKRVKEVEGGAQFYRSFLRQLNEQYDAGVINGTQYAYVLDQLGLEFNAVTGSADTAALAVEGVANTISQAVLQTQSWHEALKAGGAALKGYAGATGQDYADLATDVESAFTDMMGGLLVTGSKVTELFQKQAETIVQWKTETADSFNTVKAALSGLAGQVGVTFEKVRTALQQGVADLVSYTKNWRELNRLGASKELLTQLHALGPEAANVVSAIVSGGRKGVAQVNELVQQGADLSKTLASEMARSLEIVFDKFILAIIKMVSTMTGTNFRDVLAEVESVVGDINGKTGELEDREVLIAIETRYTTTGRPQGSYFGQPTGRAVPYEPPMPREELEAQRARRAARNADAAVATARSALAGANANLALTSDALAEAERGLADAQEQERDAQEALTQAREDARESLQDLRIEAERAAMAERSAELSLIEARRQLQEMYREGGYTDIEIERARMAVREAELSVKDAKHQNKRTQEDLTRAEKAGIKGSEQYQSALEGVQSAQEAVAAASEEVAAAMLEQTEAQKEQKDAVEDLRQSNEDLREAMENVPEKVDTSFDLDTTLAEHRLAKFLKELKEQGVSLVTDTDKPTMKQPLMHSGGWVEGDAQTRPGFKSDEVPIVAQAGEYIIKASEAARNKALLERINQGQARKYHAGGVVTATGEISDTLESVRLYGRLAKPELSAGPAAPGGPVGTGMVGGLTAAAANYRAAILKAFPRVRAITSGPYVKKILNTDTWSQHSYGNAIDVMTYTNTAMRKAIAMFTDQYRKMLKIHWMGADPWFPSPERNHYNHVHADFFPQWAGTPPGYPVYDAGGKVPGVGRKLIAAEGGEVVLPKALVAFMAGSSLSGLSRNIPQIAGIEPGPVLRDSVRPMEQGVADGTPVNIRLHLDGKVLAQTVRLHNREADILLTSR